MERQGGAIPVWLDSESDAECARSLVGDGDLLLEPARLVAEVVLFFSFRLRARSGGSSCPAMVGGAVRDLRGVWRHRDLVSADTAVEQSGLAGGCCDAALCRDQWRPGYTA